MDTVTSFHGSQVPPEQLKAIMTDYLAVEQAKALRRLLVPRCGLALLALVVVGPGLGWLPPAASFVIGAGFLALIGFVWLVELRLERQLASRLKDVPGAAGHLVQLGAP